MPRNIFIAYDFEIRGNLTMNLEAVEASPGDGFEVRWPGAPGDRSQGAIWRDIVEPGIQWCDRLLAFADLPNANVGFELGYALAAGKEVALARVRKDLPAWLSQPPMNGFICAHAETHDVIREVIGFDKWVKPPKAPSKGDGVLLLCPSGSAALTKVDDAWKWRQTKKHGWDLHDVPELFADIGRVVWIIDAHNDGAAGRDGTHNSALAILAGYALGRGLTLDVFHHDSARKVVDVAARHEPFKNLKQLRALLESVVTEHGAKSNQTSGGGSPSNPDPIPKPPAFYAEPAYLGSHEFVGRRDQLETLNEWALPADSHPVLLFEAIGGSGKSMLTWEWVRNHAPAVQPWAGRFWYSFYERGAIMADFCQRALAYMTGQPLEELRKKKTTELAPQLLHQLRARPWLLVLDGLERVLVAYHRIDAAQLRDEEAGKTDEIAQRDVCAAIRPEDDELLRQLAAAAPSKLLLTSRLIPRVLLNQASQPIPGVQRVPLPGLRPADAEALFRACGVTGDSTAIQAYLKTHCDCHPLTIGVLAGLVKDYLPDRGNFDRWSADPEGGGRLNLADLDLVQKRNHILLAAIAALSPESRQLLSMVALISEAVDYETLKALNPHLPAEIEEVPVRENPEERWDWGFMSDEEKEIANKDYPAALQRRVDYEHAVQARLRSPEFLVAPKRLAETIKDLESRGLLQYDAQAKHYDLHPVVRGVATGRLAQSEKEIYGKRVVDHFSSQPHNPYEQAETLEELNDGLHVVRTLLQMGRFQEACEAFRGSLAGALHFNLEAYAELVALLRPFFLDGWGTLPKQMGKGYAVSLGNMAALALDSLGQTREGQAASGCALLASVQLRYWRAVRTILTNITTSLGGQCRLAKQDLWLRQALDLATSIENKEDLFRVRLDRFVQLARIGVWVEAEDHWQRLDLMGRDWNRAVYRPGQAEFRYAESRFWKGELSEENVASAEQLNRGGRNRQIIRWLHGLRGAWRLEQRQWKLAEESLREAVRMARAVGHTDALAETQLALAKFRLGSLTDPGHEAEQLAQLKEPAHLALAELWLAIGDREQAKKHALAAYRWAWADGEPFVHRYELNKSRALLEQLGAEIPNLPPYDPAKDEKLPWEDAVVAAIEELRAEKAAEAAKVSEPDE